MDHLFIDTLPLTADGRYSREGVLQLMGEEALRWDAEGRPFISVYCGSRFGAHPLYVDAAVRLARGIDAMGGVLVFGGGDSGLMGEVAKNCTRLLGITTRMFLKLDAQTATGGAEGGTVHNVNKAAGDFDLRKVIMMLLGSGPGFALPGGYGTIDEFGEPIIFGSHHPGSYHMFFINPNDFWGHIRAQFDVLAARGLMPPNYKKNYTFVDDPETGLALCKAFLDQKRQRAQTLFTEGAPDDTARPHKTITGKRPKPPHSAREWILKNNRVFAETLLDFIGEGEAPGDILDLPRLGVIASQNIGSDDTAYNIAAPHDLKAYQDRVEDLARALGEKRPILIMTGDRAGLRAQIADKATANGAKVIWIRSGAKRDPVSFSRSNDFPRELTLRVSRHHEKEWLFGLLSQAIVTVAGGFHTLNQMMSYLTRNQTGHGTYFDLIEHCDDPGFWKPQLGLEPRRQPIFLFDPPDAHGHILWSPLRLHFVHAAQEGFMTVRESRNDLFLVRPYSLTRELVKDAVSAAQAPDNPDLFTAFAMQAYEQISRPPSSSKQAAPPKAKT